MKALTAIPGQANSVTLADVPEPRREEGLLLVECKAVGVCGTDLEIVRGHYGSPPPGQAHLILGHEATGRVLEAPPSSGFAKGDWVVGIVRRPDPVPCAACAVGEWDMCRNGQYTERGIKQRQGYASERFRLEPAFAVKVDPKLGDLSVLLEPASILAKAWAHIERIGHRAAFTPDDVLVTGAGPIGLLAALMGKQRSLHVHVFDKMTEGPKPELVRALGATYHAGSLDGFRHAPDIILECTGSPELTVKVLDKAGANGIVCLTGVSSGGRAIPMDVGKWNRDLVLENKVVFGSVNANRTHYARAAQALAEADASWLSRLITRRVPFTRFPDALVRGPGDVKPILVW